MRKRLLAIIATLAMVVAMMPSMVFGANALPTPDANGVITLTEDVELSGKFTVKKGEEITIDLNGHTISGTCNGGEACLILVENTGTLNVKDTSSAGNGKITYKMGTSSVGYAIDLEGKLNLYSGTIEAIGDWDIGYAVDVRPNSWGDEYTEGTVFHMYGGKLVSGESGIRLASSSADGGSHPIHEKVSATFIMDGGEIEAKRDGIFIQQSNAQYDILTVIINDGTITGGKSPIRFYGAEEKASVVGDAAIPMTLDITGGTFNYTNTEDTGTWLIPNVFKLGGAAMTEAAIDKNAEIKASGGSFEGDVSKYVEDALMVAVKDAAGNTEYFVGDEAEEAVENAPEGSVIDVMKAPANTEIEAPAGTTVENSTGAEIKVNGEVLANGAEMEVVAKDEPNEGGQGEATVAPDKSDAEEPEDEVDTGDNMNVVIPFAIAALALAAMGTVVATRRRHN